MGNNGTDYSYMKGDNNPAKSVEVRKKISNYKQKRKKEFGYINSSETRLKIKENHADFSGKNNPMYGNKLKRVKINCKNCKKEIIIKEKELKDRKFCSHKCYNRKGKNNSNWRNGITPVNQKIRGCLEMKEWRLSIFERDKFTCQNCKKRGGDLEAHHIKEFHIIIQENNINSLEKALKCRELWNISNGVTLCKFCHNKTKKWGTFEK